MKQTPLSFVVVGSGWRSLFYWRIACAYPDQFQMKAMLCRTEEKAVCMKQEYGIPSTTSEQECEAMKPDFVVVAVHKASIAEVTGRWAKKGYPVLCETPAAMTLEDLRELWRLSDEEGARIQVAEQYFQYPLIAAGIEAVKRGYLGDPYAIDISMAHDYHGASLIRRYLGIGRETVTVCGKKYRYPVEETGSRYGAVTDGTVKDRDRVRIVFEFPESGKAAFYDFDSVQYHSQIRSRHVCVRGRTGELNDGILRYVDGDHQPHQAELKAWCINDNRILESNGSTGDIASYGRSYIRVDLMEKNEKTRCYQLQDAVSLYENPFIKLGERTVLPQDETAVGALMLGMREYIEDGREVYPLADALEDAYIRILMEEAITTGREVRSQVQPWHIAGK